MSVQATHMYSDTNFMHNPGFSLFPDPQHTGNDIGVGRGFIINNSNSCFNFQPQQLQQKQTASMQIFPRIQNPGNTVPNPSPLLTPNMASQMETQKLEMDILITLQHERLRWAMQEQRKHQLGTIIKWYESKARLLLQQKDEEIAKGLNRMVELEQLLKGIQAENLTWEKVAKENEAVINSINNTIQQLQSQKDKGGAGEAEEEEELDDAESCCHGGCTSGEKDDVEDEEKSIRNKCRICKDGSACVILLPCRHLCCCSDCVGFIGCCPLCNVVKMSSLEVLF